MQKNNAPRSPMTFRQQHRTHNGVRLACLKLAVAVLLAIAASYPSASARPRTWAGQETQVIDQPTWLPFTIGDRNPNPAVARITAVEGRTLSQGSGTLVEIRGQRGLVVTNWHVIRDASGPIVVAFPDGFRSAAKVLKVDKDWDLAALLIWRPNAKPITISTTTPKAGDPLIIAGYGSGDYRAIAGRCTQYVAPGARMPYEMVEVSAEARQGDSGGPILNERGELAGVLFGAARGTTSGSFCGRVRWFLASAWPNEIQQREADGLVSVPAYKPQTNWPPERLAAIPRAPQKAQPFVDEVQPNYSVGSNLTPATIAEMPLEGSAAAVSLKRLAGATLAEQAKTLLAAVGIFAVFMQVARVFGSRK